LQVPVNELRDSFGEQRKAVSGQSNVSMPRRAWMHVYHHLSTYHIRRILKTPWASFAASLCIS
jgi:hypothetical protein